MNSLNVAENGSLLVLIATTPTFTRSGNCESIGLSAVHSLPSLLALARTCPGDRGSEVHPEDLDFDDGSLAGFMGWDL